MCGWSIPQQGTLSSSGSTSSGSSRGIFLPTPPIPTHSDSKHTPCNHCEEIYVPLPTYNRAISSPSCTSRGTTNAASDQFETAGTRILCDHQHQCRTTNYKPVPKLWLTSRRCQHLVKSLAGDSKYAYLASQSISH